MKYQNVNSSAIKQVGWDALTEQIIVVFHNGSTADHTATKEQYEALLNSESIGKHYATHFRVKKTKLPEQNMTLKR
jgi:hypothetical protein